VEKKKKGLRPRFGVNKFFHAEGMGYYPSWQLRLQSSTANMPQRSNLIVVISAIITLGLAMGPESRDVMGPF
jgi:hypothetical protein